jgi:sugar phosphate isomerase/epimerase
MRMAYQLGSPVVVNHVGRVPSQPEGPVWDLLLETLGDLGRFGQHVGAVLAAETGSEDPHHLARLIQALPSGSMGVNLDPGNLVVNGFSALDAADVLGPHVLHVHAKDGARDGARGRGVETPLGRGSAQFPELVGALEHHQYRGFFTIERENAADPVEEIGQAVSYLQSL